MCSHCLFPVVVTSLMRVTDLLQVVPTRVIQTGRITSCATSLLSQLVNNLLLAAGWHQTCWNNLLRVCWPHQPCYKMITTCSRLDNNWEQAVRTHLVQKLWDFTQLLSSLRRTKNDLNDLSPLINDSFSNFLLETMKRNITETLSSDKLPIVFWPACLCLAIILSRDNFREREQAVSIRNKIKAKSTRKFYLNECINTKLWALLKILSWISSRIYIRAEGLTVLFACVKRLGRPSSLTSNFRLELAFQLYSVHWLEMNFPLRHCNLTEHSLLHPPGKYLFALRHLFVVCLFGQWSLSEENHA
jgi:hypothetical protein